MGSHVQKIKLKCPLFLSHIPILRLNVRRKVGQPVEKVRIRGKTKRAEVNLRKEKCEMMLDQSF